jgi:iron complex outermembrane receptor protein
VTIAATRPGPRGRRRATLLAAAVALSVVAVPAVAARAGATAATAPATRPAAAADGPAITTGSPAVGPGEPGDLAGLSLEDLMNVEVTSVSKQKQRVADAPAAVSVITAEDVRRSGLNSVPELLRTVPGVTVQQLNANVWQIGSRGFTDQFSNKLLVLQDGRTLYNQAFGGVYWDMQDYLLPDLERVEVIRGPGATLWGNNAVNGVVNITTKSARNTQGLLLTGTASVAEHEGGFGYDGGVRYGGKIDDVTFYRVYGKYRDSGDFATADGSREPDGYEMPQGGFRVDRYGTPDDHFTIQGDLGRAYGGSDVNVPVLGPPYLTRSPSTYTAGGGNVLARWTHTVSAESDFSVQAYVDRVYRHEPIGSYEQSIADVDFQHRFPIGDRNELIYGAGYRYIAYQTGETAYLSFDPDRRDDYEANAFVQDDFALVPDRFHVIVGTKAVNTSYAGWAFQPSGRALWTPDERNSVWAAVSRGVRTPTLIDQYARAWLAATPTPAGVPGRVEVRGDPTAASESVLAYELGYRVQPALSLSIDLAGFVNVYDDLRTYDAGTPVFLPTPTPRVVVPAYANSNMRGESYGFEAAARWNATERLHLSGSYSLVATSLHLRDGGDASNLGIGEEGSPRNQAQVHVRYDLTRDADLNASAYYVEQTAAVRATVPSYVRVDLGVTYRPTDHAELTVGVANLFDDRHPEAADSSFARASEVPRTVFAQLTLRY